MSKRIAITGMSINTPIGDSLDVFLNNLLQGKSAITRWKSFDKPVIYSKVGADLSDYDIKSKLASLLSKISPEIGDRVKQLMKRAPWATQLSMLLALDAYIDANVSDFSYDLRKIATVVAGHNLNQNYSYLNRLQFAEEPDFIDGLFVLHALDTDHAGSISEILQLKGPAYTIGGACASGNIALRSAVDEIRYHGVQAALVVGAPLDFSPMDLHGMALMGAISYKAFNEEPERASRPYDIKREGFVPAHGGAALFLEDLESAKSRGARIYAEVLGVGASADGNHLPQPSEEGQSHLMTSLLQECALYPEQIDYISAHATSTQLGDLTEIRSIKRIFGKHVDKLKINAPKSLLGHTCWSAATVETVAAILQMNRGMLHPSINIEERDSEIDLNICEGKAIPHDIQIFMKNSFGFGGLNSISIIKRYDKGT